MHLGDFNESIAQKLAAQRRQIEEMQKKELEKLKESFESECQNVRQTIEAAMAQTKEKTNQQLKWSLILPGAIALSLSGGFFLGSWGLTRALNGQLRQLQQSQQQTQAYQETLTILNEETWGVKLHQSNNGRFLILPPDSQYPTDWKCQGRPCLKLN